MSTFSVLAKIQGDSKGFVNAMDKARTSAEQLQKSTDKVGKDIDKNITQQTGKAAGGFGKLRGAISLAAVAAAGFAAVNMVKGAVGAASAYEAEFVGVEQTFGAASASVKKFAENAAATAGLSETAALRYAKSFGGFANAAGLAGQAQADFSTTLVQTAGDLGSFFDLPTEDALRAISMGLRGEYEGLRRFNILLDDHVLKQVAMAEGIYNGTGEMTQQQKVLARQAAILDQVGVAQNDFTNYSDTYGNSIKTVGALMENLQADIGAALLPSMAQLAQAVVPVIDKLGPVLGRVVEQLIPLIEALAQSLDPLIVAIEPLFKALEPVLSVFTSLVEKLLPPLIDVVLIVSETIGKLVVALEPLIKTLIDGLAWWLDVWVVPMLQFFADVIDNVVIPAIEYLNPIIMGLVEVFNTYLAPVIEDVVNWINQNLPTIQKTFNDVFQAIGDAVLWVWNNVLKPFLGGLADWLGIDMSGFEQLGKTFMTGFNKGVNSQAKLEGKDAPWYMGGKDSNFATVVTNAEKSGSKVGGAIGKGIGKGAKKEMEKNPFLEFVGKMQEDIRKQEAKVKLAGLGLSNALVESILGDSGWEKIYSDIIKGGKKAADSIQTLFSKTTEGLEEANAKLEEWKEKSTEYANEFKSMFGDFKILPTMEAELGRFEAQITDFVASVSAKLASAFDNKIISESYRKQLEDLVSENKTAMTDIAKQRDALDRQLENAMALQESSKEFIRSTNAIVKGTQPLKIATETIGAFEQSVIDSFTAVREQISLGTEMGLYSKTIAAGLSKATDETTANLKALARQRDKLASEYEYFVQKLDAAKQFRQATKDASVGLANITSIGTSARTMIKNMGVIVQRTDKFREQLSTLNQMGLNKELYNQIVQSGLDAGSATAKAILKGGPEAVKELNRLFGKLDMSSELLADDTTKVLFDGGEQAIQGFIKGIISQDEALRQQAATIADNFEKSFQSSTDLANIQLTGLIDSIKAQQSTLETTAVNLANAFNAKFQSSLSVAIAGSAPILEEPKQVDQAALKAIETKISNATRYIANINDPVKEAGAKKKLDTYIAEKAKILNAATGGYIRGKGNGTADLVPAMVSNGEFIMSAKAVDRFGAGFMSAINAGRVPQFATGGSVGATRIGGGGKVVINNKYEINVRTGIGDPAAIGKQVVSAIAAYEKTSGRSIIG